ncbi:TPA: hypothetical protein ACM6VQ_004747, partial [Escherichia coli]
PLFQRSQALHRPERAFLVPKRVSQQTFLALTCCHLSLSGGLKWFQMGISRVEQISLSLSTPSENRPDLQIRFSLFMIFLVPQTTARSYMLPL